MGTLVFFVFLAVVLIFIAGVMSAEEEILGPILLLALGGLIISANIYGKAPEFFSLGAPSVRNIYQGTYKIGYVYVAGENVNVGLEIKDDDKTEHLYFYQFPVSAFDGGNVNTKGKRLVVQDNKGFKKLKLE